MTDLQRAWLFGVATLLLSWGFEALMIARGGARALGPGWLVCLMCIPGAVALLVRRISRPACADAGWHAGPLQYCVLAVSTPLVLAIALGVFAASLDIRRLAPLESAALQQMGPIALAIAVLGIVGAIGEEIGWRGLLLPLLLSSRVRHPYLVTGLIWALWHLPLIAFGGFYASGSPWLLAPVYAIGILGINAFICELRVRSGSVWVAASLHAAHNFTFQLVLPAVFLTVPGTRATWWDALCGDTGLTIAALYAVAYRVIRRNPAWIDTSQTTAS